MLRSQKNWKNYLNQENQKAKNWLSLKNCQKVEILVILVLKRLDQLF